MTDLNGFGSPYVLVPDEVLKALSFVGWIGEQLRMGRAATVDVTELEQHHAVLRRFVGQAAQGDLCAGTDDLTVPLPEEDDFL